MIHEIRTVSNLKPGCSQNSHCQVVRVASLGFHVWAATVAKACETETQPCGAHDSDGSFGLVFLSLLNCRLRNPYLTHIPLWLLDSVNTECSLQAKADFSKIENGAKPALQYGFKYI